MNPGSRSMWCLKTFTHLLLVTLGLAPTVDAQRTWRVDQAGGGDFRDLPAAIAAAQNGEPIETPLGLLWYDIPTSFVVSVTTLDALGKRRVSLPVFAHLPPIPINAQAFVGLSLELTNPVAHIVDDKLP